MTQLTRRQVLRAGAGAAALALTPWTAGAAEEKKVGSHTLPKLPYAADALEKAIDAKTMEIHHGKHHQAYITNLNNALADHPALRGKSIEELVKSLQPGKSPPVLVNNAGGHLNHTMVWQMMSGDGGGEPKGALAEAITAAFGNFAKFQEEFGKAAAGRFGSGWAWLVFDAGKVKVTSTANQESPLMSGQTPLLGCDVWEHAYYLRYQNRRPDYVKAWWQVVNWKDVAERYAAAK